MSGKIQTWFDALPEEWHTPAQRLCELLMEAAPNMKEEWKYSTPFYGNGRWMCYLSLQKGQLVLGFIEGVHLVDPDGLFARTDHKLIQHYLPPTSGQLPEAALRRLITEAVVYNMEVLSRRKKKTVRSHQR